MVTTLTYGSKTCLIWKFYCPLYLLQDMVLHSTVFWLIFQFFRAQQSESNSPLFVVYDFGNAATKCHCLNGIERGACSCSHSKGKIIGNLKNNSNLLYIYISFFLVKIDSQRLGLNHFISRQRFTRRIYYQRSKWLCPSMCDDFSSFA